MTDIECIHGIPTGDCAICSGSTATRGGAADRSGHEKLLILCPEITDDSLLHFNRQGESYRLRAFVGRLAGRAAWMQDDAPTASAFLRRYPPEQQVDVDPERLSVERVDRWEEIVTRHNRRLGIGG